MASSISDAILATTAVATTRGGGAGGGGTIEYAPPSRVTDLYVTRGWLRRAASAWVTSTPLQRRCVDCCSCTSAAQSARRVRDAAVYAVFFPFPLLSSWLASGRPDAVTLRSAYNSEEDRCKMSTFVN